MVVKAVDAVVKSAATRNTLFAIRTAPGLPLVALPPRSPEIDGVVIVGEVASTTDVPLPVVVAVIGCLRPFVPSTTADAGTDPPLIFATIALDTVPVKSPPTKVPLTAVQFCAIPEALIPVVKDPNEQFAGGAANAVAVAAFAVIVAGKEIVRPFVAGVRVIFEPAVKGKSAK